MELLQIHRHEILVGPRSMEIDNRVVLQHEQFPFSQYANGQGKKGITLAISHLVKQEARRSSPSNKILNSDWMGFVEVQECANPARFQPHKLRLFGLFRETAS